MISVKVSFDKIRSKMSKIAQGLSVEKLDEVAKARAEMMRDDFKEQTPVRWTGKTRNGWVLIHNRMGSWSVRNYKKAMTYLLLGTPSHGPVSKKKMFIPLNAAAADAYRAKVAFDRRAERALKRGQKVPIRRKPQSGLKYGVDYVLVPYVKGVTPINLSSRGWYVKSSNGSIKLGGTGVSDKFIQDYFRRVKQSL